MIKLGCMSLSYRQGFAEQTLDLDGFIERAYGLGLDGIDIHTSAFSSMDPEYLRRIRMAALKRGLAISYIGVSNNFGKPEAELQAEVQRVKHWLDVAAFMGVPLVRIFAAWVPAGESTEDVWERMLPSLHRVAEHAEKQGVVLGLHNHNHGCVTRTARDVIRILEAIDSPYFSHILDTGQYVGSPGASGANGVEDPSLDFYGSIAQTAPLATHVRAKIYRIQSGTEAWLDYPRILRILREVGYNGWLSIVYEGQEVESEALAVPKAVTYLRGLLGQVQKP